MQETRRTGRARAWLLHAVAPVLAGGLLYGLFRTERLLGWRWAEQAGLDGALRSVRDLGAGWSVPEWVAFSLPDALWCYAFAWTVCRATATLPVRERVAWLALPVLLGPGAELGQLVGVVPGTFDVLDLVLCVVAVGLVLVPRLLGRRLAPAAL